MLPQVAGFELLHSLGSGSFAEVYAARDLNLGRPVALKILREQSPSSAQVERFRREREVLAQLDHPHLVRVHGTGSAGGRLYVVLELLPGGSLVERLRPGLDPQAAAEWVRQAALGVGALHAQGIVHRDLKPGNLLLDEDGRVKVADLGLVSGDALEDLTLTGRLVGTPAYLAPEQLKGERVRDPRVDVYSLGVVLYEAFTGEQPHTAPNVVQLLARKAQSPAPDPRSKNAAVPAALAAVCNRALALRPEDRYPDGAALAEALHDALRPARPGVGRGVVLGLGAGALVALGVIVALAARRPDPETPSPVVDPAPAPAPAVVEPAPDARVAPPALTLEELRTSLPGPGSLPAYGRQLVRAGGGLVSLAYPHLEGQSEFGVELYAEPRSTLDVWNLASGARLRTLEVPRRTLRIAASADGARLVAASGEELVLYDAATWTALASARRAEATDQVSDLALSPDGRALVVCLPKLQRVEVWDLPELRLRRTLEVLAHVAAFRGSGELVLGSRSGWIDVRDLDGEQPPRRLETPHGVFALALLDDGTVAANAWTEVGVRLYDLDAGEALDLVSLPQEALRLSHAPGSPYLYVAAQGQLCRIDVARRQRDALARSTDRLFLALLADAHEVFAAGTDQRIQRLSLELTPSLAWSQTHAGPPRTLVYSEQGTLFLGETSRLWSVFSPGGVPVPTIHSEPGRPGLRLQAADARGRRVVVGDGSARLYTVDLDDPSVATNLPAHPVPGSTVALGPDGVALLASWDTTQGAELWRIDADEAAPWSLPRALRGARIAALELTPDGRIAVSGDEEGSLRAWSTRDRSPLEDELDRDPLRSPVTCLALDGDRVLAGTADGRLRLWTRFSSSPAVGFAAHDAPVYDVLLLPAGRAASASQDGRLVLWELEPRRALATWSVPDDAPRCLALSPDGQRLAVATLRGAVHELALPPP
ncbi:MAG: serine/threonine-protein kinase [Planctomycetota bacterium]